jgi:dynein heavy chain
LSIISGFVNFQKVCLLFVVYVYVLILVQNVHLVARWLSSLEKKLEQTAATSHENYRVFISAEPAPTPESHIIPQGILESSIKITNEPPTGMFANLHKALDNFNQV